VRHLVTFLFGSGWWVLWHLFVLAWALPVLAVLLWVRGVTPGAGPQGGEVMFLLLVLALTGLTLVTVVHALLWAGAFRSGHLRTTGLWLLGWIVAAALLLRLVDFAASASEASPSARAAATAGAALVAATVFLAHLGALWRLHRA
jgi:hypothetical protein